MMWQTTNGADASLLAAMLVGLFALAFARAKRSLQTASLALALAAMLLLLITAGDTAAAIMAEAPRAVRVSLGWGFWAAGFCFAIAALLSAQRLGRHDKISLAVMVVALTTIIIVVASGRLASLSLLREYAAQHSIFWWEGARHCVLVAISVVIAVGLGAPLGLAVARRPEFGAGIFGALNLLQTIPSVALFGLLIAPLSALGLGGIGPTPAIIALVLYSLLPVARSTAAGISGVDAAVIDAARGMGLGPTQILFRIELPLALPVFVAGLRLVTVQAIGLAAVAALIGGGGFGNFIFQGIGQYATDLVLLGALPTILLALAADLALGTLHRITQRTLSA